MNDISISVYHILHFTELIDRMLLSYDTLLKMESFKQNQNAETRKIIYVSICSQILLHYYSMADEYKSYFNISKAIDAVEKEKVKQVRELLKPIFKKIGEWRGINGFRDNVLAHNLRDKKQKLKSVFLVNGLSGYDIPERYPDFVFLVRLTNTIRDVIYQVFEKEYIEIDKEFNLYNSLPGKKQLTKRDYSKELKDLKEEMIKIQRKIPRTD
jgi:hypothetical protein